MNNSLELVFDDSGPHRWGGQGPSGHWDSKGPKGGLRHLLSLDLACAAFEGSPLPRHGSLSFFSDLVSPGFDPADQGSCYVCWQPNGWEDPPQNPSVSSALPEARMQGIPLAVTPAKRSIFLGSEQLPRKSEPEHHLLGFPFPEQHNQMELQCALVHRGLYCGRSLEVPLDLTSQQMDTEARSWRLLLQINSVPDRDLMLGDQGVLYLFIEEQRLLQADFSRVWQIIQS